MLRGTMAVLMLVGLTGAASAFTCRLEVGGEVFLDGAVSMKRTATAASASSMTAIPGCLSTST